MLMYEYMVNMYMY